MKKILLVTGIFPPDIGGPATYADIVSRGFRASGFFVTVLTYGVESREGVAVVSRSWPKGLRHVLFFLRLFFLAFQHDVIFTIETSFGSGFIAALVARITRKKMVVRIASDYAWEQSWGRYGNTESLLEFSPREHPERYSLFIRFLAWAQSFTVYQGVLVIVPSEYLRSLAMRWGVPASSVRVIYNGVALPSTVAARDAARVTLGLQGLVVFAAGRLVSLKGFDVLIHAFAAVASHLPTAVLIIAGNGPEYSRLSNLIRDVHLESRIKLVGQVVREQLFQYLAAADCFVIPSVSEGFSNQLIEAMAIGVPVVATSVGGNIEVVRDGTDGLLVPHGDPDALAENISKLFSDPLLRQRLGDAARRRAADFSEAELVRKLVDLFSSFI